MEGGSARGGAPYPLLVLQQQDRGSDPFDATTVLRAQWR